MDQVKQYLAVAIKYGFWIGSAVILIGALAIWYLTTSDLDQQTTRQISKIEGDFSKVSQFRNELPTQPNEISHEKMQVKIDAQKQEVLTAWQSVFDAQRGILTWPEVMQDSFLNEFKYAKDPETGIVDKTKLKLPFEKYELFPPTETDDAVPPFLLRRYEQYIDQVLPDYAAIAQAKWTAKYTKRGGGAMSMEDSMMNYGRTRRPTVDITGASDEPVVRWSMTSQEAVMKDLFPWRGTKDYPSELDVYYSQENLWILRQLLQIVATVNGDAKQSFEAKIHEIKKLAIGKSVTFDSGTISDPGVRAKGGFGGMMDGGYEDMMMEGMDSSYDQMDSMGGMGLEDAIGTDPGDNRYVNTAFEPIAASSLRAAFTSNDPSQVAIAVAKRVPIMLQLQMDQRSVPTLLAACGSAPLMVDVHQVRIVPKGGSTSSGGGGGYDEMMMSGGMEDEMMGGMGGMGSMGPGMGGGGRSATSDEPYPLDMDVEIYGLIYFYNPPSEESLGIEKVTTDVSIDQSAEVIDALPGPAVPADTTPAVTPPANTTGPAVTTPEMPTPDAGTTPDAAAPVPDTTAPVAPGPATPGPGTPADDPAAPAPTAPAPTAPAPTAPGTPAADSGAADAAPPATPPAAVPPTAMTTPITN
ncbi:hypothetical protein NHH03_07390 [Stieleria sp. TO1_6]|uniref:hypothetical protein n=1 Tax=Stieleria tagensis TaxID=2956795 RepID=UPI00209BB805|nr:hypothetical protein [Stieleria tagensis]MCO8121554.1 hypothetical protein [Stieleria tagensis]